MPLLWAAPTERAREPKRTLEMGRVTGIKGQAGRSPGGWTGDRLAHVAVGGR